MSIKRRCLVIQPWNYAYVANTMFMMYDISANCSKGKTVMYSFLKILTNTCPTLNSHLEIFYTFFSTLAIKQWEKAPIEKIWLSQIVQTENLWHKNGNQRNRMSSILIPFKFFAWKKSSKSKMKILIVTFSAIIPIVAADIDELYNWDTLSSDLREAFSYKGNVCISMGRRIGYNWRLSWNRLLDTDYALGTYDAEYFFYREQKARDRIYRRLKRLKNTGISEESCCTCSGMKAAEKYPTGRYWNSYSHNDRFLLIFCQFPSWAVYLWVF